MSTHVSLVDTYWNVKNLIGPFYDTSSARRYRVLRACASSKLSLSMHDTTRPFCTRTYDTAAENKSKCRIGFTVFHSTSLSHSMDSLAFTLRISIDCFLDDSKKCCYNSIHTEWWCVSQPARCRQNRRTRPLSSCHSNAE